MDSNIRIHSDMRIVAIGDLQAEDHFLYPVTHKENETTLYIVLGVWGRWWPSKENRLARYTAPSRIENHARIPIGTQKIVCLDSVHGALIREFNNFDCCMIDV